jgi:hypothetical protein
LPKHKILITILDMPPNNYPNPNMPSDPYAFMNNGSSPRRSPSFINPQTTKGRVILFGSLAVVLVIVFVVVMSILGSADRAKSQQYIELGQRQAEIIRLTALGETKARSLETRSYALTVRFTMLHSQSSVNKVIDGRGISSKQLSKELTKSKNTASDQLLTEAERNNRFDETFKELIDSEIAKFQQQINAVAEGSTKAEKRILEETFKDASLLTTATKKET